MKWIYNYSNNREALWRNVVCAYSKGDSNSLMLYIGNRENNSMLLGFVNAALGSNSDAREVISQEVRILIGNGWHSGFWNDD